ncbi:NUDIX hydrolase [Sporomusa acidovorans]|uniref:NADH pyrophosphatase n=2 Tax=Sporomusa TaxID=2375 RepID=A0ABZ3IXE6_SPOA4|nr:NUDIX hydrolase [Sporomusa acidovorans]OZC13893.1 CTP pyrophosphohydrolase [Sporomusa acidovorans DSM 3132]SDF49030.1 ADP-ribose pyrophosphatase YjhB, NUDIX family [Sporomusa acidovorans]
MRYQRFNFCPQCGGRLSYKRVGERERLVCEKCSRIMYENPIVGVAAILFENGEILLGRRAATASFPGLWCIPCGYVEYDEDIRAAVKREFLEETGLSIEPGDVYAVLSNFHNPAVQTVGVWFEAQAVGGSLCPGDDLDQVAYFALDALPQLAFPTDKQVVNMLLADSTMKLRM